MPEELDIYYMTDQPETCRKCGTRTTSNDTGKRQHHTCPSCKYEYILEEDDEDDYDYDYDYENEEDDYEEED
jgi:tRNA(Ile2) C34 agmatinyltransferase TiaS